MSGYNGGTLKGVYATHYNRLHHIFYTGLHKKSSATGEKNAKKCATALTRTRDADRKSTPRSDRSDLSDKSDKSVKATIGNRGEECSLQDLKPPG